VPRQRTRNSSRPARSRRTWSRGRVGNLVHEEAGPSPEASSRCTIGPNTTFSRPLRDCRPPTVSGSALSPNCSARAARGSRTAADRPTRGFSAHPDVVVRAPFERDGRTERVTLASRAVLDRRETRETVDDAKDAISDGPDRQRRIEELSRIATAYPTPTTSARPPRVVVRPSPTTCRGGRWSRVTSARSTYSLPSPVRGSPPGVRPLLLHVRRLRLRGSATRRRRRWPCSARATSSAWTPTRSCSRRPPSSVARRTRTARGPHRVWADSGKVAPGWANARIEGANATAGPNDQLDQPASVVAFLARLRRTTDLPLVARSSSTTQSRTLSISSARRPSRTGSPPVSELLGERARPVYSHRRDLPPRVRCRGARAAPR